MYLSWFWVLVLFSYFGAGVRRRCIRGKLFLRTLIVLARFPGADKELDASNQLCEAGNTIFPFTKIIWSDGRKKLVR